MFIMQEPMYLVAGILREYCEVGVKALRYNLKCLIPVLNTDNLLGVVRL